MKTARAIGEDAVVSHAAGLVAADMDEEKVMLHIESGNYYGLDSVGSRIWELIEKPYKVRELVLELLKKYEVEEKTCRQDVLAFLNKLYAQGLIDLD